MECSKCQFDNREGVKFCEECGSKLEIECPVCKAKLPPGKKFCGECGHALIEPQEIRAIDYSKPQSYIPKFLADKILTNRSTLEGERKLVTVLFADVANYTTMSEKLDPEEVHQIMDDCFKILLEEIHRFEGTINQFTGDGVMALFGAPVAHEDHAQRACYGALSIQRALENYSEKIKRDYNLDFKMRIGLNSGPVVVASIGDDLRMDYTAVGDTTNLAARMESKAEPGKILLSEATHKLVKDFFEFYPLGKVEVKGKEQAQEAYELIIAGEVKTRIKASVAKGLTKFVGRKNSMVALKDSYKQALSGSGQVVGIVGEAGVGKSRVLFEFVKQLPAGETTYLEGRCLHFGSGMVYLPILDMLRAYFEIIEGDPESLIKAKLLKKIRQLDERLSDTLPSFQELLSVKVDEEKYMQLNPGHKKMQTFEAIRNLFIRVSERQPLVLAVEDLRWIDKTSEECISYLIDLLANTRIMLILLYRLEYTYQWGSKSYYTKIGLTQLGSVSGRLLVQAILEDGKVPREIKELVLSRAGGNPLFVEELTQNLMENGTIVRKDDGYMLTRDLSEIQVPDTIQSIIAARIDRIEESMRNVIQVASVIGREFAFRILQSIIEMKNDLKSHLLNLQGLELISQKRLFPELEYIFKHALTQEVAYNSLLQKRRKELHEKIGSAIEALYPESLEEYYELLAYHYGRSGNKEKAFEYLDLANQKAAKYNAMEDAEAYFGEAMGLLDTLPDIKVNQERRTALLVNQQFVFVLLFKLPEYYELLTRFEPVVIDLNDPGLLAMFYVAMGHCEYSFGYFDQAIKRVNKALKLFETAESEENAIAYCLLQWCHLLKGDYTQVISLKEEVVQGTKQHFNLLVYVWALSAASLAYGDLGRWNEALEEGQEALRVAEEFSDNSLIAYAAWTISWAYVLRGDLDRAIENGEMAVQAAPTPADKAWARMTITYAWIKAGELNKWIETLEAILPASKGFIPSDLYIFGGLGEGYLLSGKYDKARQSLDELVEMAERCGARLELAWGHRLHGELALKTNPKKAALHFEECIAITQEIKPENELAHAHAGCGRYFKLQGDLAQAREYLTKALEIFERLGTLNQPEKVRKEIGGIQ